MPFVRVAVPLPVHGLFTYTSPVSLSPGAEVLVPFGKRKVNGWVVEALDAPDVAAPKDIERVVDEAGAFDADQLRFYRWVADYYLAPLGEVVATATPAGASSRTRHVYRPTDAGIDALAADEPPDGAAGSVLREIVARPGLTKSALTRRLHGEVEDVEAALRVVLDKGWVDGDDVLVEGAKDAETWVSLVGDPALAGLSSRAVRALEVLAKLANGPVRAEALDTASVTRLERAGVVKREKRARLDPWRLVPPRSAPPVLNAEQQAAVDAVKDGAYLLHGVTGAGKTEVYLALAARTLDRGAQVLVLVPEIALTPQLVQRFSARFGDRVAVLHSGLTGAERLREWRRIREGRADVAVGARSAIFAPFRQLGLVVVDEENDDSYKQDEGVRYHARDLAVVRGRMAGCPVVLGSATPSLETWENARQGRYGFLSIRNRATARPVPTPEIVDVRGLAKDQPLSPTVRDAVADALAAGGKAILLYNRRGYATFVECPGCGLSWDCPSCGIALVYHQGARRLDCHYCGFHRPFQPDCPRCGTALAILGRGTERIEEAVAATFPGVPVGRMDADTTSERGSHARILDDFREGRTRLLVGTQIVAKGHDFPDVHVAAVLGADHILGMPDFRSAERTFALVTQLCGRAGRGEVAGRVFVQTAHPEHYVFGCIGDMDRFAGEEGRLRRMLGYPPFSRLVLVRFEHPDRAVARSAAEGFANAARADAKGVADVLGPAHAPLARLVGRWRWQVVLRGRNLQAFRAWLSAAAPTWKAPTGVRRIVDVDPRSLA